MRTPTQLTAALDALPRPVQLIETRSLTSVSHEGSLTRLRRAVISYRAEERRRLRDYFYALPVSDKVNG